MKITINNMQELAELVACIDFPKLAMMHPHPGFFDALCPRVEGFRPGQDEPYGHNCDVQTATQQPEPETQQPELEAATTAATQPEPAQNTGTDSAGFHWDERIHAPSRTTNADGTWRKKRNVVAELLAQVEAEQLEAQRAAQEQVASDEGPAAAEVATETHALPTAEEPVAEEPVAEEPVAEEPAGALDYDHLLTEASARAEDLAGDMVAVLAASRSFTAKFGHQEFQRLKQAATPTDDGHGKSLPSMSPAERRLVQAVMELALADGGAQ